MTATQTTAPLLGEPLPVELMNTIWADRDGVHEALASAGDARSWLAAVAARADVPGPDLTRWLGSAGEQDVDAVHQDLRALRDAARCLAALATQDTREPALTQIGAATAVSRVNELAASAQAWPVLEWPDGGAPHAAQASEAAPGPQFVADLARATIALFGGSAGLELRACEAPGCVLYFVKQHPRREWCSAACGNRARQARHYRRHHSGS